MLFVSEVSEVVGLSRRDLASWKIWLNGIIGDFLKSRLTHFLEIGFSEVNESKDERYWFRVEQWVGRSSESSCSIRSLEL